MKSKTSFFNKGIFWKNVTLYWPIWSIYTIILLIFMPGLLWLESNSWGYQEKLTQEQSLNIMDVYMEPYTLIIACMALVTGLALFSYLFNAKTANMIHSLPVDRNQLFGTNVISGLVFLIVPQILTFVVSVLYCLNRGISHMEYLAAWLFMSMVTAFIAYSIVTFCSFLTGQLVTMVGFVVLINIFSFIISALITWIYEIFAFGVAGSLIPDEVILWCSPYNALMCLEVNPLYENEVYVGMDVLGKDIMIVYSIIAVILYVISWFLYKKRHIEHAGDLLTVPFLKPVFRWGVGFCVALAIAPMVSYTFMEIGKTIPIAVFVLVFVAVGMMGYFVADMLLKKSFKVFKKKYFLQWGIFSIFLAVSCVGIYFSTVAYENAMPDKEDVAHATIDYGYSCTFEKEELDKVFAVHEAIIENKDLFEKMKHERNYNSGYDYVMISYYADDGSLITCRNYRIPYNEEGTPIFQMVWEYEKEPEKLLGHLFNIQYQNITTFGSGSLEYIIEYKEENDEMVYEQVKFDSNAAKVLYEAVIADAYAGTLYAYNAYWRYEEFLQEQLEKGNVSATVETSHVKDSQLWISYKLPESESSQINKNSNSIAEITGDYDMYGSSYWENEEPWRDIQINFGADCTNIVNALVELGLIASADEIP